MSDEKRFSVCQEMLPLFRAVLNILPSTNIMCIENDCSPSFPTPIFVWLSQVVGISVGFMLDSKGHWKYGGGRGGLTSALSS